MYEVPIEIELVIIILPQDDSSIESARNFFSMLLDRKHYKFGSPPKLFFYVGIRKYKRVMYV